MPSITPVTIITGFLGAGKTTILSNLLRACPESRISLLVNEFGQTSVDGTTLRELIGKEGDPKAIQLHEINNSLIAYANDELFLPTMNVMKKSGPIDNVLIETSGLARPTAVMASLQSADLRNSFQLDAVLVVVDAEILIAGGFDIFEIEKTSATQRSVAELFRSQLETSDVVILNKIDKISPELLLQCEEKIRKLAPAVRFIELAFNAKIDPRIALGLRLHQVVGPTTNSSKIVQKGSQARLLLDGHMHDGLEPHVHGIDTHEHLSTEDPGWMSFSLHSHTVARQSTLEQALTTICEHHPILRLKGFVQTEKGRMGVQGVRLKINWRHPLATRALALSHQSHSPSESQTDGHSHSHHHAGKTDDVHHEHSQAEAHSQSDPHQHQHSDLQAHSHSHSHESESEIVFIGYNLSRKILTDELNKLSGAHWH